MTSSLVTAGVDVGGERKGFHAVALKEGAYFAQFSSLRAGEVAGWCRRIGARVVGVDAPCRWSRDGRARPAERALMKEKVMCFSTPTHAMAMAHRTNYFRWMLNGADLFADLETTHALFSGKKMRPGQPVCFETFPQAIACALAGKIVPAKAKRKVRRELLDEAGVEIGALTNIDKVDAALCALAAHCFARGNFKSHGDEASGFIVVPGHPSESQNNGLK